MITRFIALTNFFLQFNQVKQVLKGTTVSFRKSETVMIKDVISETTASIELKLNKLYFKMALGLIMVAVLAYGVIRLVWHFESYLMLNYGENYAVLLLAAIVAVISLQMIYLKYAMEKVAREKREQVVEKAQREKEIQDANPGFFAAPEKLLHQAFLGFLKGFSSAPGKNEALQLPAGDSAADRFKGSDSEYPRLVPANKLDQLRGSSH